METNCAAVTVSKVDPETEPDVALMFAVPAVAVVASPFFTVATVCVSEDHVAVVVRF